MRDAGGPEAATPAGVVARLEHGDGSPWWSVLPPHRIGWEPYLHVIWLAALAYDPLVLAPDPPRAWVSTAILVAVFVPAYLWAWVHPGTRSAPGLVVMTVVGIVGGAFNLGAGAFLVLTSAGVGYKLPYRTATRALIGLTAGVVGAALLSDAAWPQRLAAFAPALLLVPLVGYSNVLYAGRDREHAQMLETFGDLQRLAAMEERERISRDLHDLLGQTLSVIAIKADLVKALHGVDEARARSELDDLHRAAKEALSQVREAVGSARRRSVAQEFAGAQAAFRAAGIALTTDLPATPPPPRVDAALAMIAREGLTNVLRHARARRCSARLSDAPDAWSLEIRDDGHGRIGPAGNGVRGIAERVAGIGGSFDLRGGRGVRLTVAVPYGHEVGAAAAPAREAAP